jgi:hypothetical protein
MNESGLLPSVSIAPVAEGERLQISSIGVATRNRFSELKRCLGSYICNLRRHGRGFDLVVVDDSDKSEDRNACRAWLRCLSHKLNLKIFYAGFEEKLSYVDRIASMGLRADLVRFVLTNPLNISSSPGANRNAILLHSVGELVLACDDDSVCFLADLRNGPQSPRLVRFGNVSLDTHFVANRRSAVDSVHRATCDVFAAHEELLGKCIIDRLPPGSGGIQESSIWREDNSSTSVLGKRKVTRITASGVLGNSGMPNCIGFMLAKGEVRERFLHQWSLDDSPYSSQYVIRGVCRPIVARSAGVMMTTATGLDNRVPLPPFISSGRGEDTLFGVTASQCFPDMYIGFVPFALLHAPPGRGFSNRRCDNDDPGTISDNGRYLHGGRFEISWQAFCGFRECRAKRIPRAANELGTKSCPCSDGNVRATFAPVPPGSQKLGTRIGAVGRATPVIYAEHRCCGSGRTKVKRVLRGMLQNDATVRCNIR